MYTHIGLGIVALAAIMVLPISEDSVSDSQMYGFATIALNDATGNTVFEQVVHNIIVADGESFMLAQTFNNGSGNFVPEVDLIDTICVTMQGSFAESDAETATSFNANSDNDTQLNCIPIARGTGSEPFTITNVGGVNTATSFTETFNATGTGQHVDADSVITGIGICSSEAQSATDDAFQDCSVGAGDAPLLAVFNTADVTLGTDDTVDITYTLTLE